MSEVAIVNYGMGNLDSVARAIEECGGRVCVTSLPADLERCSHLVLPGVGAFVDGMKHLTQLRLDDVLQEQVIARQIPILGICLGMQLMATLGREGSPTAGLGWIPGEVVRFEPTETDRRIPHIGWNEVYSQGDCALFADIPAGKDFYFVHSYHFRASDPQMVLATTPYCGGFASAVGHDNIFGVQFHPEKSQRNGFALLKNFLSL